MIKKCNYNPSILKEYSGFTLFELIIAIVLIGILVGVAGIRMVELKTAAQISACVANQQSLNTAQRMYYVSHALDEDGAFADNLADLASYLKTETIPECPTSGNYEILPNGNIVCTIPEHLPGN